MILKQHRKKAYMIMVLFLSIVIGVGCERDTRIQEDRIAMGTSVSIAVFSRKDAKLLDEAFMIISDIEREISSKDSNSYISKINENAGISPVSVSEDVYQLIKRAVELAKATDGLFNPAIGALVSLWGITTDNPHVPTEEELSNTLSLISYNDIILDDNSKSVFLAKKGMSLDLGGIGKGYASDKLKEFFISNGVDKAIINLGGNVYAIGFKDEKSEEKWKVGIVDPIDQNKVLTTVEVDNKAVVTSGGYERYFEDNGIIYHHILDSETGYPANSNVISSTIITSDGTLADALSTAVFAGGMEYAKAFADKFDVYILVATKDDEILTFGEL